MKCEFDRIEEFFMALNQADINYLVLRNYEKLLEPEMYVGGHGDIDLLCDDARSIVQLVEAQPMAPKSTSKQDDGIHYLIFVDGKPVQLDLRQVGDGYYCTKWEKDLLERKIKQDCFYVMNDEDYFYSLIYHAVLQKRSFSDDYRTRLSHMAKRLAVNVADDHESTFLSVLQDYMRNKGYRYTYSQDYMVPNRFHLVDQGLVTRNSALKWRHLVFDMRVAAIGWLVKVKHHFTR